MKKGDVLYFFACWFT